MRLGLFNKTQSLEQVDALAKVVFQNRRGLILFFKKQRGVCVAVGETPFLC